MCPHLLPALTGLHRERPKPEAPHRTTPGCIIPTEQPVPGTAAASGLLPPRRLPALPHHAPITPLDCLAVTGGGCCAAWQSWGGCCVWPGASGYRTSGILSPGPRLTDGWLLGGPHGWMPSREKPQLQPSKSINKLISKYCCLLSPTGTPGQADLKSTTDGHRACRELRHPFSQNWQAPVAPRVRSKAGGEGKGPQVRWVAAWTRLLCEHTLLFSLAPLCCFLPGG